MANIGKLKSLLRCVSFTFCASLIIITSFGFNYVHIKQDALMDNTAMHIPDNMQYRPAHKGLPEQSTELRVQDSLTHQNPKNKYKHTFGSKRDDKKLKEQGVKNVTLLEDFIATHKIIQAQHPKTQFEMHLLQNSFPFICPTYNNPYDTIVVKNNHYNELMQLWSKKKYNNPEEAERSFKQQLEESTSTVRRMLRSDSWEIIFAHYDAYLPQNICEDHKRAIYELHDSLALSWNDTIYVWTEYITNTAKHIKNRIQNGDSIIRQQTKTDFLYIQNNFAGLPWQEQLQLATKTGKKNNAPIKLKGYKETGVVKNEKHKRKVIKELFSPHSCIALKNGAQATQYGIYNIGFIGGLLPERENIEVHLEKLKEKLGEIIEPGMKMVELEWEYKNYTYYTTAFVSQKTNSIVYDNVGSIATGERIEGDITRELENLGLPYRNTSEKREEGLQVMQPAPFGKSRVEKDLFGSIKYSCYVFSEAKFNEEGVLEVHETKHDSYAAPLFDCKAGIRKIESTEGECNQCSFAWIMGYGTSPVKLIWGSDNRPTVSCADDCEQGEGKHKPTWW